MKNKIEMFEEIKAAVQEFNAAYLIKHPHDWDCCGFANIKIYFGRKRKLKTELIEAEIIYDYAYKNWAGSYHLVKIPHEYIPCTGHQSLTYKEDRCEVIMEVMKKYIDFSGVTVMLDSYMD